MLIGGEKIQCPPRDVIVYPRASGNVIFHIKGVDSFEAFDGAHPRPEPPQILRKGQQQPNYEDEGYARQIEAWANLRQDWLIIQALDLPDNDITWEKVDMDKASTWHHVEEELRGIGLTLIEFNRLVAKVYEVNALSERSMEAARANFLQMTSLGLPGE